MEPKQQTDFKTRKSLTKIDKANALKMRINHNLTYKQIAEIAGVSTQAIHQALQPLLPDAELLYDFKAKRADILAQAQLNALTTYLTLDPADQRDMMLRRGLVDLGILYDKERLETGQSTQHLAIVHQDLAQLRQIDDGDV